RRRARRVHLRRGFVRRRSAVLGRRRDRHRRQDACRRPLYARHQRYALRHRAGVQQRRTVLRVPARRVQRALCGRRPVRSRCAEDAFDRTALPHRWTSRTVGGAFALPRLRAEPRRRLDRPPHRYRPTLDRDTSSRDAGMTLAELNARDHRGFVLALEGIFENSPWVAESAWMRHPFASFEALYRALVDAMRSAGDDAQLELIRAHPQLSAKVAKSELTRDS